MLWKTFLKPANGGIGMAGYLLGYDVGSSAIKAALVETDSSAVLGSAVSPADELPIQAPRSGWAEQDPDIWWTHVCAVTRQLAAAHPVALREVRAIGLSYQMHGLVLVDRAMRALRPAILWCDSRAVDIGRQAFEALGEDVCMQRLLNSPGNFTASKLKWVKDNEPDVFARVHKAMLPGDYVALRMTGEAVTTPAGLSEGILWDYQADGVAETLLAHYGIPPAYLPSVVEVFFGAGYFAIRRRGGIGIACRHPAGLSQRRSA